MFIAPAKIFCACKKSKVRNRVQEISNLDHVDPLQNFWTHSHHCLLVYYTVWSDRWVLAFRRDILLTFFFFSRIPVSYCRSPRFKFRRGETLSWVISVWFFSDLPSKYQDSITSFHFFSDYLSTEVIPSFPFRYSLIIFSRNVGTNLPECSVCHNQQNHYMDFHRLKNSSLIRTLLLSIRL
jgi:hypothetical protein